jgi:hypothetical protein
MSFQIGTVICHDLKNSSFDSADLALLGTGRQPPYEFPQIASFGFPL